MTNMIKCDVCKVISLEYITTHHVWRRNPDDPYGNEYHFCNECDKALRKLWDKNDAS